MMDEFIEELEERRFIICQRICDTPFFCFKALWQLKSQNRQLREIIKLAKMYEKKTTS